MAAALRERFDDVEVRLIESSGGRFEVVADGRLIYSKEEMGRHPTHEEIFDALD